MCSHTCLERVYYNEKIDVFSLGVLMLEIATQYPPSIKYSGIGTTPEIQRRSADLSRLPEDHPLKPIILQCLRDDPGERPDSGAVFRMLSEGEILIFHAATKSNFWWMIIMLAIHLHIKRNAN